MNFSLPATLSLSMLTCLPLLLSMKLLPCNPHELQNPQPSHVAPMQGYTHAQTRKLINLLSPSSIKWTEMEKIDDIFPKSESLDYLSKQLERRLGPPDHHRLGRRDSGKSGGEEADLVLQLGTNDPRRLRTCAEHAAELYNNLKEINLNCGCPAIDSGGAATYGASLMKDSRLTGALVEAARKGLEGSQRGSTDRPLVSVKCRIGVFETDADMRPLGGDNDYKFLKDYVSAICQSGGDHVVLHARPAVLSGLSPVKNRIIPALNYDFVEAIASDFKGRVDVTLNGGITTLSRLRSFRETSGCNKSAIAGHMAGRWCLRRPLDLVQVEDLLVGGEESEESTAIAGSCSSSLPVIQNAIEQYIDDAVHVSSYSSSRIYKPTIAEVCLPLFLITEQLKDDYEHDEGGEMQNDAATEDHPVLNYNDIELLYEVLEDGVAKIEETYSKGKKKKRGGGTNFKRLSSSFKSLVGTKVANKWKRNRAEL